MYHYHFDWKLFEFSMMLLNYKCKSLSKCLLVQMPMLAILIFETILLSQPDGLILYNEGKDNDFIAIELKQGHLHYTYNMGWMKTSHLSSFSSLWRSGTGRWLWKTTLQPRWQTTNTTQFGSGDQVGKFRSTENNDYVNDYVWNSFDNDECDDDSNDRTFCWMCCWLGFLHFPCLFSIHTC